MVTTPSNRKAPSMRTTALLAIAAIVAGSISMPAEAASRREGARSADTPRAAHARRMVRALDDLDDQYARRQRQVEAEMRALERASRKR
jgi:hypothetical protein